MRYVYPAIFAPDFELEGYYTVEFPDIEVAITQGKNFSDAYRMAEDILNLVLMKMENEGEKIPEPTALENVKVNDDKFVGLVEADTDTYRKIFHKGLGCHEVWYSPITKRKFFVIKDGDEELCKRVGELISKISGVKLNGFWHE